MNVVYKKMLSEEVNPKRIEDIKKQISLNEDEIDQLRQGKPLFGTPKPLKQKVTLIVSDPETKGQKITKVDETGKQVIPSSTQDTAEVETINPSNKKVGNKLREMFQTRAATSAEESLKAKVLAAKAKQNK